MDESKRTPMAVVLAAVLHLGILAFLYLAILPCSAYEKWFELLHLPAGWNPIACAKPLELPGQPIEAGKRYIVSGWASVNEGTQGPPIWDVVRDHVAKAKTVSLKPNTAVKVSGA